MSPLILASFCLSLLVTGAPAAQPTILQDPAVRGSVRITSPEGARVFRVRGQEVQEEQESQAQQDEKNEKDVCPHCGHALEGAKKRKSTVWYTDGEKSEGRAFQLGEGGEFRLLEGAKGFEKLKGLQSLKALEGLKGLESLKGLEKLKDLQKLESLKVLKDLKGWTESDGKKIEAHRPLLLQRTRANEQGMQERVIEIKKSDKKKAKAEKKAKADKKSKAKQGSTHPHTIIIIRSGNGAEEEVEIHSSHAPQSNEGQHEMFFSMPTIDVSSLEVPHFVVPELEGQMFEIPTITVPTIEMPDLKDLQIELQDLNVELEGLQELELSLPQEIKIYTQPAAPAAPQKKLKPNASSSTRHLIHL